MSEIISFIRYKTAKPGFLFTFILAIGLLGCNIKSSKETSPMEPDAFITDRVVTVRIVMKEESWVACQQNALAEQYVRADFWFDGELVPDVGVRPKGNSSLRAAVLEGSPRFNLKVDFNLLNKARNFRGLKKLNLNCGWSDPTLIREHIGYALFDEIGVPCPRSSFIDLWVNDTHLGVYTMVEQIDKTFLKRHFSRVDGNIYKPEALAGPLNWTKADLETQNNNIRTGLDINFGGGKLSEIMQAIGHKESTMNDMISPSPSEILPDKQLLPVGSHENRPLGKVFIETLDKDQNGRVSKTEFPGPDEHFRIFDLNSDGYIEEKEAPVGSHQGVGPPGLNGNGGREGDLVPERGDPTEMARGQFDYIELAGLKTNEKNPDHSALFHLLDILNNEPDQTFPDEIEKVLDVDEVLRFLAVSTLIVHLDNYIGSGHNYYLYEIDGKFIIIPWDLNMAFGTFKCHCPEADRKDILNLYIDEPTCGPIADRPLINRLFSHPAYLDTYHRYLKMLLEGPFEVNRMMSRIDELATMIRPFLESDKSNLVSIRDFERGLAEDVRQMLTAIGLKTFVVERSESVKQQLDGKQASAGDGNGLGLCKGNR